LSAARIARQEDAQSPKTVGALLHFKQLTVKGLGAVWFANLPLALQGHGLQKNLVKAVVGISP
jgi:hypothetical protein